MNTVYKTPEQDFNDKIKKVITETPAHNWYRGSDEPDIFERQYLPEPDLHLIALEQAGKLKNDNLEQLLGRAEEIERWLRERPKLIKTKLKNYESRL